MWKPISGYHRKYLISDEGEVMSVARVKSNNQPIPERIMKLQTDTNGYKYISLYSEEKGNSKRHRIHRLVASAFIRKDDFKNKKTVNHKNGIKDDNRVANLEWVSQGENKAHSFRVLGEKHWLKGRTGADNPYSKRVCQYDMDGNLICIFDSTQDVTRILGFFQGNVASVCRGSRKTAHGYKWRYL